MDDAGIDHARHPHIHTKDRRTIDLGWDINPRHPLADHVRGCRQRDRRRRRQTCGRADQIAEQ